MNRLLYLISTVILFSCNTQTQTALQTEKKSPQVIQNKKIIHFIGKDFYKWTGGQLVFEKIETILYDFNQDGHNDSIVIERAKGWESEPGDFQRIKISILGEKEFLLQNIEGWIRNKFLIKYDQDFNKDNLIKSDYVIAKRASEDNLLLFIEGYVYASIPGFLTIINIYNNETPTLIFNDNIELFNLNDYNNDGIKDLGATVWDGFYTDEQKNKYRYKVYLLDGGFTYNEKYSKQLSEEMYQKKE